MKNATPNKSNSENNGLELVIRPIFISKNRTLVKIDPFDVTMIIAEGNYTRICFVEGKFHLVRSSLSDVIEKLPASIFIKTHRTYVVSLYHIGRIEKDELMVGEKSVPISRQNYDRLIGQLNIIN